MSGCKVIGIDITKPCLLAVSDDNRGVTRRCRKNIQVEGITPNDGWINGAKSLFWKKLWRKSTLKVARNHERDGPPVTSRTGGDTCHIWPPNAASWHFRLSERLVSGHSLFCWHRRYRDIRGLAGISPACDLGGSLDGSEEKAPTARAPGISPEASRVKRALGEIRLLIPVQLAVLA